MVSESNQPDLYRNDVELVGLSDDERVVVASQPSVSAEGWRVTFSELGNGIQLSPGLRASRVDCPGCGETIEIES